MKIYWSSRHKPLSIQVKWLEEHFGEPVEVVRGLVGNAREIAEDFRRSGCAEMVIVAPLWVIYHLLEEGICPLWADMEVVNNPDKADLHYRGRFYRFNGFKRIKAIKIEFEDL